jgi:hypothetical protein
VSVTTTAKHPDVIRFGALKNWCAESFGYLQTLAQEKFTSGSREDPGQELADLLAGDARSLRGDQLRNARGTQLEAELFGIEERTATGVKER